MTCRTLILASVAALLAPAIPLISADKKKNEPARPEADPDRIINESYSFLREREPEMTETEYALYEKVIPMISAQPDFALRLLEGMVAEANSSAAFEFVLGNVYFEQKRYPEAEARFKLAIEKYDNFIRAWDNLGILYFTTERYAEAVPCFTKALTLGATEPRLFGLLAFSLLKSGNPLAAEAAYLQAYALDPDNGDWIEGLLSTYLESEQFARAETLLRQLVRVKPKEKRFWLLLGNVVLTQGRKLDAIAELEAAASLDLLEPDGLAMLGDLYAEQNFHAEAARVYGRLASAAPELGTERLIRYAEVLTAQGKFEEAQQMLTSIESAAQAEHPVALLMARARLHQARTEWPQAVTTLERLLERDPMNGAALFQLGEIEETLGHESRAAFYFESAARLPDQAYSANLKLANLHVRQQHFEDALACLDAVLAQQPSPALLEFKARVQAMATPAK